MHRQLTGGAARDADNRALLACLWRTLLVGSAFNTRGLQNIGLAFAMDPGLKAIHRTSDELVRARRRYIRHYNTHPYWTPLLVGIFLFMERRIARQELPPEMLDKVKVTTTYTLSALGDSFFGGSLLVFWALLLGLLVVTDHELAALLTGLMFFLGLQVFKVATFVAGFREGFSVLQRLKRWDLINWGTRIKYANAALLGLFWLAIWPQIPAWELWLSRVLILGGLAWLVSRAGMLREVIVAGLLAVYLLYPVVEKIVLDLF